MQTSVMSVMSLLWVRNALTGASQAPAPAALVEVGSGEHHGHHASRPATPTDEGTFRLQVCGPKASS